MPELFGPHGYLDETIEWNTFLVQAHSTKKLDWICNWNQSQKVHHVSSHANAPRQEPATLVSCALQVLDEAGHLDFNIQDPCSLEVALTRIGAVDQLPVEEHTFGHNRQPKKVTFSLPGANVSQHTSNTSCSDKEFSLKEILEHALASLTPMQTLAVDLLLGTDSVDGLNNSLMLNFQTAISSMNSMQSLAVAVKVGYLDMNCLPEYVDSNFIIRNTNVKK